MSHAALSVPLVSYIVGIDFVLTFVFLCTYIDLYDIDCVLTSDVCKLLGPAFERDQ